MSHSFDVCHINRGLGYHVSLMGLYLVVSLLIMVLVVVSNPLSKGFRSFGPFMINH